WGLAEIGQHPLRDAWVDAFRQSLELPRCLHAACCSVGFTILGQTRWVIYISRSQSKRTVQAARGHVAQPIDALKTRAVCQMKTRNRIRRLVPLLGVQKVRHTEGHELRFKFRDGCQVGVPSWRSD